MSSTGQSCDNPRDCFGRRNFLVKQNLETIERASELSRLEQMLRRSRPPAERPLCRRERLVEHNAALPESGSQCGKEISLKVPRDHYQIEPRGRQRMPLEICTPRANVQSDSVGGVRGGAHCIEAIVDRKCLEAGGRQRNRVTSAAACDIERA